LFSSNSSLCSIVVSTRLRMDQIKVLKKKLDEAEDKPEKILETLEELGRQEVTVESIKETRIGKRVGKLRKHEDLRISNASSQLVEKWKRMVEAKPVKEETNGSQDEKVEVKKELIKEEKATPDKKRKKDADEDETKNKKTKKEPNSDDEKPSPKTPRRDDQVESKSRSEDDQVRKKVIELLSEAVGKRPEDVIEAPDAAKEIEEELFKMHKGNTDKAYKTKYRSLAFNLKNPKNPDLRANLMQGVLTPHKLCHMTPQEMASPELKEKRKKYEQYHLEAAKTVQSNQTSTDMFKCGKCGKRETTYYQLQTRSADEPMTTFHTCQRCGNRWKS